MESGRNPDRKPDFKEYNCPSRILHGKLDARIFNKTATIREMHRCV